jgi:hypothetical protein
VTFPKGFIRRKASIESQLPSTKSPKHEGSLAKNICYTLIEADVLRWLLARTDLGLVAQRMVIKEFLRILGDVCDSLMVDSLYGQRGPKGSYKQRTDRLSKLGVIDAELKRNLDWLWDQRTKIHLWQLTQSEFEKDKYDAGQYKHANETYDALVAALKNWTN